MASRELSYETNEHTNQDCFRTLLNGIMAESLVGKLVQTILPTDFHFDVQRL